MQSLSRMEFLEVKGHVPITWKQLDDYIVVFFMLGFLASRGRMSSGGLEHTFMRTHTLGIVMMSQTTWLHSQTAPLTLMETRLSVLDMVISKTSGYTSSTYTLVLLLHLLYIAWPDPIPHRGKEVGTWPQKSLSPRTMECIPITVQYSVKYLINEKIQNFSLNGEWTEQEVFWVMSCNKVQNHECRKVASLTLVIAIADVMTGLYN